MSLLWRPMSFIASEIASISNIFSRACSANIIEAPHNEPFVGKITGESVESPHKGPVMREASPCHDVNMIARYNYG